MSYSFASNVYSVCFFHNGHYLACSNAFETKSEAKEFVKYCKTMDPSKLSFSMYKHSTVGEPTFSKFTQTQTEFQPEIEIKTNLSDMTLERYGRGFLLRPPENSSLV